MLLKEMHRNSYSPKHAILSTIKEQDGLLWNLEFYVNVQWCEVFFIRNHDLVRTKVWIPNYFSHIEVPMVWFSHWTLMIIWCNLFWVDTVSFVSNLPADLTVHGNWVCPQSWEVRVGNGRPTSCRVFIHWMITWFVSSVHPLDDSKDLGFGIALLSLRIWGMGPLCGHSSYWWLDPIFTWYMVSLELQMDVKRICVMMRLESICLICIDTILGSIMNTLGKVYVIIQRVMAIFVIHHNCQWEETMPEPIQWLWLFVESKVLTIEPHTLPISKPTSPWFHLTTCMSLSLLIEDFDEKCDSWIYKLMSVVLIPLFPTISKLSQPILHSKASHLWWNKLLENWVSNWWPVFDKSQILIEEGTTLNMIFGVIWRLMWLR